MYTPNTGSTEATESTGPAPATCCGCPSRLSRTRHRTMGRTSILLPLQNMLHEISLFTPQSRGFSRKHHELRLLAGFPCVTPSFERIFPMFFIAVLMNPAQTRYIISAYRSGSDKRAPGSGLKGAFSVRDWLQFDDLPGAHLSLAAPIQT